MPLRPSALPYSPINQSQSQSQSREQISVRTAFVDTPRMNQDWLKTRELQGEKVVTSRERPLTSVTNTFSDHSRTVEMHDDSWNRSTYTRNKIGGGNNSQEVSFFFFFFKFRHTSSF